jgi:tetratricopeptide (TPR) repeat protein
MNIAQRTSPSGWLSGLASTAGRAALCGTCLIVTLGLVACAQPAEEPAATEAAAQPATSAVPMTVADLGAPVLESAYGKPFVSQEPDEEALAAIAEADAAMAADPENIDLVVTAAQARVGLGQYNEAIEIFTGGIEVDPNDWRLYRHRGHRFVSTRRFDWAIADLQRAVELDPYGFNSSYHLGLAYFLNGEFGKAADEYARCLALATDEEAIALAAAGGNPGDPRTCMEIAGDDESRVAVTEWLYRALRRAGRADEAAALLDTIPEGLAIEENIAYYRDLLFYKGLRTADEILNPEEPDENSFATTGYGVASYYIVEGDTEAARELIIRIVEGDPWNAFGFIAAETELLRIEEAEGH